jgi:hypothetical protein
LRYWNEHEAFQSFQYLHTLVESVCQKYHRINLEDSVSQLDPRNYKRSLLDVQFNSQEIFGYMLLPKESWLRYMKFSKSGKSGTKRSSTNLQTKDNL